jgi:putative DNA primase/helicase
MGGDPVAHRAFLLYGDGRNGKSTLLDTLRYLIGDQNCSAVSMKVIDKPFSMVQMDGKLANIVEESPAQIDAEAFKNIVGGGTATASYKGKDEFQMKINARLVFACNSLPTFKDSTSGTNDRLIILPFNRYIKPDERDTGIKNKIFAEISGILNWAIEGYTSFKYNEYKFVQSDTVSKTLDEYRVETDSVYAWCKENISHSESKDVITVCRVAYDSYSDDCKEDGYGPVGKRKFLSRLKSYINNELNIEAKSKTKSVLSVNQKVYEKIYCRSQSYVNMFTNQTSAYKHSKLTGGS